jgi:proteasome lid subunit RPN8/RPN11
MSNNFTIKCGPQQMKLIEEHCFSETEVEVGGFLVGIVGENETHVSNVFPAEHSVGASTQLTFTHESWNTLYDQLKNEPEGTTLVGWYHSHPNFGVFLSEHDKFIQSNFFKQDGNVTIVVDPIKGRKGWFYSKKGKIEKYKQEVDTDRARLGVSATDSAANIGAKLGGSGVSLKTVIAISAVMSLLSFVLGWTTTSLTSGGGGASQAAVSKLYERVNQIDIKVESLRATVGTPKVATKAKTETTPKLPAPAVSTKSKAKPSTNKKTTTSKVPAVQVKVGNPCKTAGAVDKTTGLKCAAPLNGGSAVWTKPASTLNEGSADKAAADKAAADKAAADKAAADKAAADKAAADKAAADKAAADKAAGK